MYWRMQSRARSLRMMCPNCGCFALTSAIPNTPGIPVFAPGRDHNQTVHVVGHDDEGIQQNVGKMARQTLPLLVDDSAILVQVHLPLYNFSEQATTIVRANRDEIGARLPVIVIFQADGSTVMFAGVVGHRCVRWAHLASTTIWPAAKYSPRMRTR